MELKNVELRSYQKQILDELKYVPSIGLFMGTGSGKTLTGLARAEQNKTKNLLVICPQKIISQWWEVLEKNTTYKPLKYKLNLAATKKDSIIEEYIKNNDECCVVVNFDIICKIKSLDKVINDSWTIIVDESHKIKNVGSTRNPVKITKRCLELGELTKYKIIMTATPTEKNLGGYIDYYSQLKFLGYIDYNIQYFRNLFCILNYVQYPGMPFPVREIIGYRKLELDKYLMPIIKNTCRYYVAKYGDYEPQYIDIKIPKAKNYNKLLINRTYENITFDNVSAFRVGKKSITSGRVMGTDEYGSKFVYEDNTEKESWLEEFLKNTDEVVSILYCYNVEKDLLVELCEKIGKKYVVINGNTVDKPNELKKDFDVVIGQYGAFSEGLDGLQYKCHIIVYYSMPDSSLLYRQSLGRIDRIGQTKVPTYYHLIMEKTIDEKIYEMLKNKIEFSEKDLNELKI